MIILLNGPAGSGKDTLAAMLLGQGNVQQVMQFKEPMFDIAMLASGINATTWWHHYNDRALKEAPCTRLGGLSFREFMIHISEKFIKPVFGDTYFGDQLALKYINRGPHVTDVAVSDSGFQSELDALNKAVGPTNVMVVRLNREGYTFKGDSRTYVTPQVGNHFIEVDLVDGYPSQAIGTIVCVRNAIRKGSTVAQIKG
ncbi:ATPase [Aeromonas phage vB_AspA_Lolek]|nr:ATPase [Aeromonas phage vB_AspA_Lolek]